MKIDVEKITELDPAKIYAVEVANMEQFHTFMQMAVHFKNEHGLEFFCYIKDRMRFIEPKEVDEIVNRIQEKR